MSSDKVWIIVEIREMLMLLL